MHYGHNDWQPHNSCHFHLTHGFRYCLSVWDDSTGSMAEDVFGQGFLDFDLFG
ncbi:uncharacterized protein METZ01_LOCUS228299 [marine metagenome]|uniref:Uncharacterized protein n=1 Tax=marine metagenome TaxID=408172 RepID=A0A382GL10_9ZZZZ